jgi:thioredoxin 1
MINILTDENFDKAVNSTNKFVLVDFFATWCGPCSVLGPILEKLDEQYKDRVVFMKADVDNVPNSAQKFNVEKIPNVVLLKNGKVVNSFVGLVPEQQIINWLENAIK